MVCVIGGVCVDDTETVEVLDCACDFVFVRVTNIVPEFVALAVPVFDKGGERERVGLAVCVLEDLILAVPVGLAVVVLDEVIVAVEVLVITGVREPLEVSEKDEEELEVFDAGADLVNEGDAD